MAKKQLSRESSAIFFWDFTKFDRKKDICPSEEDFPWNLSLFLPKFKSGVNVLVNIRNYLYMALTSYQATKSECN